MPKGRKRSSNLLSWLLAGMLLAASGCAPVALGLGAAAGGGGVMYAKGDLQTTMQHTPDELADAAVETFRSLNIAHDYTKTSELHSKVVGKTTGDKKVKVAASYQGEGVSKLSIRVGVFGDEEKSRRILREMKKYL